MPLCFWDAFPVMKFWIPSQYTRFSQSELIDLDQPEHEDLNALIELKSVGASREQAVRN
jgi:hypothetical protein